MSNLYSNCMQILDEIESLNAIFSPSIFLYLFLFYLVELTYDFNYIASLKDILREDNQDVKIDVLHQFDLTLKMEKEIDDQTTIQYTIGFTVPPEYPDIKPMVTFTTSQLTNSQQNEIQYNIEKYLLTNQNYEVIIYSTYLFVEDELLSLLEKKNENSSPSSISTIPQIYLGFRIMWFHHIRNPLKRKSILNWSSELGLYGGTKIGYPGVVYIEGLEENCCEMVRRLKTLRWKAIVVRYVDKTLCENMDDIDNKRKFPKTFTEYGNDELNEVFKIFKDKGMETIFYEAVLKIQTEN